MGSLLPTLRSRPAAAAPVPVEGLGPAEGRAESDTLHATVWRGWVADLSDAELATLHAIVEEQQAKWVVPQPVPVPEPWHDYEDEPWDVTEPVPVPVKAPPKGAKVPPTWVVPKVKAKAAPTLAELDEWGSGDGGARV